MFLILSGPPIPYNITLAKPTDGNLELDCYVSWEMPSDGIASNFIIYYNQMRGDPIQFPVYVQAPSLNGTISATCPGEILSVLMQSYHNGYDSPTSKMTSWYQTGKVFNSKFVFYKVKTLTLSLK